jgi:hypothetical protein
MVLESCTPRVDVEDPPTLHPDLLAVAPQYFHAPHDGGFDAYRGGPPVFPWFDLEDLEHPIVPPTGVRVASSTTNALLVVADDGELGVMPRGEVRPRWTGHRVYPWHAVEGSGGGLSILARGDGHAQLVTAHGDDRPAIRPLALARDGRNARLATTATGRVALVFARNEDARLRLFVSWSLDPADAVVLDEVEVPAPVAALSDLTGYDLAATADGTDALAIAWRPLTDAEYTDVGSQVQPPSTPARAEVRWLVVRPDATPTPVHRHATTAQPLGGVTGIGPWSLYPNGMKASTLGGRAFFAWNDGERIVGVRAPDDTPVDLARNEDAPLLGLRPDADGLQVLLLGSAKVRAVRVRCG